MALEPAGDPAALYAIIICLIKSTRKEETLSLISQYLYTCPGHIQTKETKIKISKARLGKILTINPF